MCAALTSPFCCQRNYLLILRSHISTPAAVDMRTASMRRLNRVTVAAVSASHCHCHCQWRRNESRHDSQPLEASSLLPLPQLINSEAAYGGCAGCRRGCGTSSAACYCSLDCQWESQSALSGVKVINTLLPPSSPLPHTHLPPSCLRPFLLSPGSVDGCSWCVGVIEFSDAFLTVG